MFDDLALLELQSKFDNKTEIISLPESAQYNAEQVGKGKVLGSDTKSKSLVYLDVSVLTLAECSEYYTSIYSHQVCVINTKTNSCTAESGFPFIQIVDNKSILVGIASCSLEECAKAPSMYTRVDKYLSFINKSINGEKFVARC
ncbi:kallikrein-10-like [Chrysoperla carnea]|uniref:kallikrein-10-like n=1 Tax=Chrysoperla carnea TaxID=189513 RepID=UPI001D0748A8|nr:kallikrein-10-like [Chrysoperla carnea]